LELFIGIKKIKKMINIYFHLATIGDYQNICDELIDKIIDSELIDKVDVLYVCVVGDNHLKTLSHKKIEIVNVGKIDDYEFPTLQKIESDILNIKENIKIFYLNGLGVTGNTPYKQSWRKYLSYFNIILHNECIKSLDDFDVCGVDWRTNPTPHFSGNFWWTNSNYLKLLPKISTINQINSPRVLSLRHNAEMYIGMNNKIKPRILWQSNISQYERHLHLYDESNYVNKINTENIIIH
jgi:hypothetical protein